MRGSDPEVNVRRQKEAAACRSAIEIEELHRRWQTEDRAAEAAADWRTREVVELRRRVAALERLLGPGGKRLLDDIAAAVGGALGAIRAQDRERVLADVERRGFVTYGGVWDESTDYARGALVTHGGSAWVALTSAEKGLRPGKAPAWRLAVKGESSRGPTAA